MVTSAYQNSTAIVDNYTYANMVDSCPNKIH